MEMNSIGLDPKKSKVISADLNTLTGQLSTLLSKFKGHSLEHQGQAIFRPPPEI